MTALNVMIVDDSGLTIKKITKMMQELGHNVVKVSKTGLQAINDYDEAKPDLVTMDITMPDMDGIEATKNIIEKDPEAKIIMVTSHGQEQMVIEAISAGALGYVLKPIKMDKMQESIERIFS